MAGPVRVGKFAGRSPGAFRELRRLRAYPNNRLVMRPSEKFEAKAAGQKCSEAWFAPR